MTTRRPSPSQPRAASSRGISTRFNPWLRSLVISHRGHVMPVGSAIPIINGVTLVGAIGVARSSCPEQDVLCCRAAINVWENLGH